MSEGFTFNSLNGEGVNFENKIFVRIILLSGSLLFSTLACRAATNLIFPPTATPFSTGTLAPPPTFTPALTSTPEAQAVCTSLLADIVEKAQPEHPFILTYGDSDEGLPSRKKNPTELVVYRVIGDKLGPPHYSSVPEGLKAQQQDTAEQQKTWDYFTELIPADQRSIVTEYEVMTDGSGELLAAVAQAYPSDKWVLAVDIADAENAYNLTYTLLHEFGHLLTLNADQVPPSKVIYDHPQDEKILADEIAACPQYFPGEGCSKPDSYLNQFYQRFWTDIHDEWLLIDQEQNDDAYYKKLNAFYRKYRSRFITPYSATSPEEDIAESWSFFMLTPGPTEDDLASQKIRFFYSYPELTQLRDQILNNLCTSFPAEP